MNVTVVNTGGNVEARRTGQVAGKHRLPSQPSLVVSCLQTGSIN